MGDVLHNNYRVSGAADGFPVAGQPLGSAPAGAGPSPLFLSPSAHVILSLAAAHDGVAPQDLVTRLVCQHAERIGISALGDLAAVPAFERANVKREGRGCG